MEWNARFHEEMMARLGPGGCECWSKKKGALGCPTPGVADSVRAVLWTTHEARADWLAFEGETIQLDGDWRFLRQFAGLEIAAFGTRAGPGCFAVDHVLVRAARGRPAHDGILRREESRDVLVTLDGERLTVGPLPASVRDARDRRIWIAGPSRAPSAAAVVDTSAAPPGPD